MPSFLVEIYAPALGRDAFDELIADTQSAVDRVIHEGSTVRLVHSICVPEDETCFFTFEGPSEEAVRHTARLAGLLSKTRNATVKPITDLKGNSYEAHRDHRSSGHCRTTRTCSDGSRGAQP